jgi:eukaryotic-like serine/threonine-protein kinase
MRDAAMAPELVLEQLRRMVASETFRGSERAVALLTFLVEQTVGGHADRLKEYTVGAEALGRGDGFDPRSDPIVRAEMSRLRARVERYYAAEGRSDPIEIALAKGSYVPQFAARTPAAANDAPGGGQARASILDAARWFGLGAATAAAVVAAALWTTNRPTTTSAQPVVKLEVELTSDAAVGSEVGTDVVISPDGTRIVFVSRDSDGNAHLNARRLDQSTTVPLAETEGARTPFLSPDGRWVGFWAEGKLKKVPIDGGSPIVLCDASDLLGGSWGDDDTIVAAALKSRTTLWRVAATGGTPTLVADLTSEGVAPVWPQVLPGGKQILFTAVSTVADTASIALLSLRDGTRTTLVRGGTFGRYVPGDFITYVNQGTMYAIPFDVDRGVVRGAAVPVLNDVAYSSTFGFAQVDMSRTGTLVYRSNAGAGQLAAAWIDAAGGVEPFVAKPGRYVWPSLSPDGNHLALSATESGSAHVSIFERGHDRAIANLADNASAPLWTSDGRHLVVAGGKGLLWVSVADARPHVLLESENLQTPWSFAPDGRLAYQEMSPGTAFDLWTVPIKSDERGVRAGTPEPFLRTPAFEVYPSFSPDGKWLAFGSNRSGSWEVYVRAFPDTGSQVQISAHGGRIPRWMPNHHDLVYRIDDQRLMVVAYEVKDGVFVASAPRAWSPQRLADTGVLANFDVAPDGRRVLGLIASDPRHKTENRVTFILNFGDDLRRRSATAPLAADRR